MAQIFSVVFDVWEALGRLHREATWPAAPDNAEGGMTAENVFVGSFETDLAGAHKLPPLESLLVVTASDPVEKDWATSGFTIDEEFTTQIVINTALRGRTSAQARVRLKELSQVAETVVLTGARSKPTEIQSKAWWWGMTSRRISVGPLDTAGHGGTAVLTIAVKARIGGI